MISMGNRWTVFTINSSYSLSHCREDMCAFFPNAAKEKNFHARYKSMIEEKYPNRLSHKLWDVIAQDDEHDYMTYLISFSPSPSLPPVDEKPSDTTLPREDTQSSGDSEGTVNPAIYQF